MKLNKKVITISLKRIKLVSLLMSALFVGTTNAEITPFSEDVGSAIVVESEVLDQLIQTPELITHGIPLDDGGIQIDQVLADGPLAALGLQEGDVVRMINTQAVGANLSLAKALAQITNEGMRAFRLEFERDQRMEVFFYEVQSQSDF